jgi:serine/threonine protein kinase
LKRLSSAEAHTDSNALPFLPSRYTLLGSLGAGGGGLVFRAFDRFLSTEIALKVAPQSSATDLLYEFEAFRQIRHANLVRVHDWLFFPHQQPFYTMEFMSGGDWGALMGRQQDPVLVKSILTKLMRGLGHLHCHGVVHGDLKPGNVLFGLAGEVKLSDVGMGNLGGEAASSGTPGYAAPELWEGARGDFRSDIYSASVMAYEAITGHHPFEGRTIREVISSQLDGWVPSPEAHGVRVDPDLARSIMRGLERDPKLRQGAAEEYLEALGVEDRVGEILGGRFIDRADELSELRSLLNSENPGSPTLAYLLGQEGSGRKALALEFAHAAALAGCDVLPALPEGGSEEVAEKLSGSSRPLLITLDSDFLDLNRLRTVARYVQAIAIERGQASRFLVVCRQDEAPQSLDSFERAISLRHFTSAELKACVEGYLGKAPLEIELLQWLADASGSVPGHLISLLGSMIERGLLRRRSGQWSFVEGEQLRALDRTIRGGQWDLAWGRLGQSHRRALRLIAQFPQGLPSIAIEKVFPEIARLLPELATRGWVRSSESRWRLASLEARRIAVDDRDDDSLGASNEKLRNEGSEYLSREERAALATWIESDTAAFEEGLWAAQEALVRGSHDVSAELVSRCLGIAQELNDDVRIESALLLLASVRQRTGDYSQALSLLDDKRLTREMARREFLRGAIEKAQGETAKSRMHLDAAIELAEREGNLGILLVSLSELAELDWRHGDEQARVAAMDRVRRVLLREYPGGVLSEERAGLSYQLGAALIVAGRREEAKEILHAGMALDPGDYWSMRLATALGTAEYYLGHFDEALAWMREAWGGAERGGFDTFKARIMSNRAGIVYAIGGFRQAVEYHDTASMWARRTGSRFEFIAACQGAAVNLMLLAEYEQAIVRLHEGGFAAREIKSEYHIAKSIDLEALIEYHVGDWHRSSTLTDQASIENARIGHSDISPRIDLMRGRLARIGGNVKAASAHLRSAGKVLTETKDWEDLPGVQIELELLGAREDPKGAISRILEIARRTEALTIQLSAAVAIGEVVIDGVIDNREGWDYLTMVLGRADEAGALEAVWRINSALGEVALRRDDRKVAATRFAQSLRGFRQVADKLSAERRSFYVATPHARHLVSRVS